jgi:ATP-dependent Lhr-like helicase
MVQRIGRANHRLDEPSRALIVPANRFEMLECQAAREAVAENALDWRSAASAPSTPWPSTSWAAPVPSPSTLDDLYDEVRLPAPTAT